MYPHEIIVKLGMSEYILWRYLEQRQFVIPSMDEMVNHFGRHRRTIKNWLKNLTESGYIQGKKS
ncbi:helix-turn-helix domain-containing protein [Ammoniphilus sp. 3BR4]|uniref:helix-turn-helix domain-containing protein n=1 Tax=Ammoniphilus sp. 3BR4 TaxID=3158265 RepID=UPI003465D86E